MRLSGYRPDLLRVLSTFGTSSACGASPTRPLSTVRNRDCGLSATPTTPTTTARFFSKSSQRDASTKTRGWVRKVVLGALGLTTSALMVCVHSGAPRGFTVAAGPDSDLTGNLESAEADWKETKDRLLSLPVDERRRNQKLDGRISVHAGDITKLEVDAI
ncbi:hypothetical protein NHX12_012113, partial [Muraenolepis orangiensis]